MAAAALSDIATFRIPNLLVVAVGMLFLLVALLHYADAFWIGHIAASVLCFLVGLLLYRYDQMGAGDVKLLSVAALWPGLQGLLPFLFLVTLAGLIFMLLVVATRLILSMASRRSWIETKRNLPRVLQSGEGIPYGVAICLGSIAAIPSYPAWLWTFV